MLIRLLKVVNVPILICLHMHIQELPITRHLGIMSSVIKPLNLADCLNCLVMFKKQWKVLNTKRI